MSLAAHQAFRARIGIADRQLAGIYRGVCRLLRSLSRRIIATARAHRARARERTTDTEVDEVIAAAVAREGLAAEQARRAEWKRIEQSAASFADISEERLRGASVISEQETGRSGVRHSFRYRG